MATGKLAARRKIEYLDGIRGLAAIIVVFSHFFQVFLPSVFEGKQEIVHFPFETWASRTPVNLLFNGNFSVNLFFVLSGYVLSYRYFKTKENWIVYSSAARRYFRLAVPAFLSVVLAFSVMKLGMGYFDEVSRITLSSMPDPYLANASLGSLFKEGLFHTFFTYGYQYNPVLWTMTYELFGSFLIFFFLLLIGARWVRILAYLLLIYYFIDSYYLGFVLGMLLADFIHSGRNRLEALNRPWISVLLIAAGIYAGSYPYVNPQGTVYSWMVFGTPHFSYFVFYHALGSFFIITALVTSNAMQALFGSRVFAYLGKISFSLYLVHFTIICSLSSYIFLRLNGLLPYGANLLLTTAVSLPFIFLIAHYYYRYIDAVTVSLLSKWSNQLISRLRGVNALQRSQSTSHEA